MTILWHSCTFPSHNYDCESDLALHNMEVLKNVANRDISHWTKSVIHGDKLCRNMEIFPINVTGTRSKAAVSYNSYANCFFYFFQSLVNAVFTLLYFIFVYGMFIHVFYCTFLAFQCIYLARKCNFCTVNIL